MAVFKKGDKFMNDIKIKVYDENDEIIKEVAATEATIRFGAVRHLMKLLKVDEMENTGDIFGIILDAWDEVTKILTRFFPDMEEDDWDNVNLDELVPAVIELLKGVFSDALKIPKDPKN